MKKIMLLIFAMFLIILIPNASALALFERYNDNTTGVSDDARTCRFDIWTAQTFTLNSSNTTRASINVSKIAMWFEREGSPVSVDICIYSTEAGVPKNSLGCNYTVAEDTPFTGGNNVYQKFNISIPDGVSLNMSGTYAIVCNGSDSGSPDQFLIWHDPTPAQYSGGQLFQGVPPITLVVGEPDLFFEIWAENGSVDTTLPTINSTAINNTAPEINDIVQFSTLCSDDTAVQSVSFADNITGTLTNVSSITGLSQSSVNYSVNITNNLSVFNNVAGQFTCIDTSGNSVQSGFLQYIVADETSPVINFLSPTPINNSIINYITLVFNVSIIEPNLDTIVFNFNGTNETNTFVQDDTTHWHLNKMATAEGDYTYSIFVNDTSGNIFQSETLQFNIDNVPPVISYLFPTSANDTISKTTGNINIFGFNIHLTTGNLSVYNSSNDLIYNNLTEIIDSPTFFFTDTMSQIFSGQPDGIYRFSTTFIDLVNNTITQEALLTLDNTAPTITYNFPASDNSTITEITGNIDIAGDDLHLDFGNLSVFKESTKIYENATAISPTTFTFTDEMTNIFEGQTDGNYLLHTCFRDVADNQYCQDITLQLANTTISEPEPEQVVTRTNFGIQDTLSETGNGIGVMINAIRLPVGQFALFLSIIGGVVALILGLVFAIKTLAGKHI